MNNTQTSTENAARPRVLVVDDDPLVLSIVRAILAAEFDVRSACTGDEALSMVVDDASIAVVISDLQMPGVLTGSGFLGQVRHRAPDVVRIALTADDSASAILDAVNRGHVFRYLVKPVQREMLVAAVRDAVDQRRLVTADRDLLRRKVSEMTAQLMQSERLATLGTLANGVGHELNNMAAVLTLSVDELQECQQHDIAPHADVLRQLERVAAHVSTHARYLLHLGKPRGDALEVVDLADVADDVVSMLSSIGRTGHVTLRSEHSPADMPLLANRTRLEQVLTNLVLNAADAALGLDNRDLEVVVRASREGGYARLEVSDNASGISAEHLPQIFEPYFSTKGAEHGTGLGLAVVRQIVEAFGGEIGVRSVLGEGTTFTMYWPILSEGARDLFPDVAA